MKYLCFSDRQSSETSGLLVAGFIIVTILCTLSFGVIEESYALGLKSGAISTLSAAKSFDDLDGRLSNMAPSWSRKGQMVISAAFPFFRQKSLKAYRYHHEHYKMIRMLMGRVLVPIFYILKYPKVSLFFFFLITVFLAILDEFLYRYQRSPRMSDESASEYRPFHRGIYSQLVE